MDAANILGLAAQFGPMGLFIGYLIWREKRQDEISEKRVEADLKVAEALTLMRATMEGMRHVP